MGVEAAGDYHTANAPIENHVQTESEFHTG